MSWGVSHLLALLTGFCLDLLLGDPTGRPTRCGPSVC